MRAFLIVLFLALLATGMLFVLPQEKTQQGHMKLLAVTELGDTFQGSPADVYLEIQPGNGRIFIDTFPLTKLDTQISTRFAKEIACRTAEVDCSTKDFFYTIRAESGIIGGASAGAALTVLTVALLEDYPIDESVAITGTINSGGFIGPVIGLTAKIDAAAQEGITKVLIPKGRAVPTPLLEVNLTSINDTVSNETSEKVTSIIPQLPQEEDLYSYAAAKGITLIEVTTLHEALQEVTGKSLLDSLEENITISPAYQSTMKEIALRLCNRTDVFLDKAQGSINESFLEAARNQTTQSTVLFTQGQYYSAASLCFGANIQLQYLLYQQENMTYQEIFDQATKIDSYVDGYQRTFATYELTTITDLQAFIIVQERLQEADDYLQETLAGLNRNDFASALYNLAYAQERMFTSLLWGTFFEVPGTEFNLEEEKLEASCLAKLAEAEERYQYVTVFFPQLGENSRKNLAQAYEDFNQHDYAFCLFRASKAKAETDFLLSVISLRDDLLKELLQEKLEQAKRSILKQQKQEIFPILGYSYYEYALSLQETDPLTALTYVDYALELSNIDLYFPPSKQAVRLPLPSREFLLIVVGLLWGMTLMLAFSLRKEQNKKIIIHPRKTRVATVKGEKPKKVPRKELSREKRGDLD
ncbi:hypothetical protein HYW21_05690 [Candidatus Woesearchaeota archaeon]|nr:hypothetical protein [Candidatus Woesearchaeota archaeon]